MEEIILKCAEFGILGVFSLLMLTKGLSALNTLSDSQKTLAAAIDKLADKINSMDGRISNIEREVRDLSSDFLEIKQMLKSILQRSAAKSENLY